MATCGSGIFQLFGALCSSTLCIFHQIVNKDFVLNISDVKLDFFVSMTFRGEWGMHNLFLQGKSPIGEPRESILHQKNCLSFQLSQLCNSVIPLALPVEKT